MRSKVLLTAIVVAAIASGSVVTASAAGKSAPAPTYAVGDWWLMRNPSDPRGRNQRLEIIRVEDGKITTVRGPAKQENVYDLQFNEIEGIGEPTGRKVTYQPHTYNFDFPLEPGKDWGGETTWSAPPYEGKFRIKATAKAWEEVSLELRAGPRRGQVEKLDAIRIEYEHDDGGKVIKSTCWYSPKVRFAVRCESPDLTRAYEVVDYAGSSAAPEASKAAPAPH
jgi:hypothetical protein